MRGRSLGAALAAAAIGGGLGVAVPTVASAEMYVNVLPTSVPTTGAEVGKHACETKLGGGPYPDRDVWVFELPGDRVRTGDIVALTATFRTPAGQEVSRKVPGEGAGIVTGRKAWLVVDHGRRLTAATAAITGTVRNFAIAQTCPAGMSSVPAGPTEPAVFGAAGAAPMLEPVAARATPTPTPTPTPTVTPTARPTPTPTATPTPGLADLPHGTVDLTEPDADPVPAPAPVIPPAVSDPAQVDTTGYADGVVPGIVPDAAFSDGGPYADGGVIPGGEFGDTGGFGSDGGFVDNGGVIDNTFGDSGIPADPGAVLGGDSGTFGGNGSFSDGDSFSDGGAFGGSGSVGGDQGGAMGDAGDLVDSGPTGDTPVGNPIASATSPTTGLNVSGAGSATSAETDNLPNVADAPNPAGIPATTGSAAPAAVTLRSDDDRLAGNAILRLAGILLVFVLAGVGMALIRRRRRRLPRLMGRHRAA